MRKLSALAFLFIMVMPFQCFAQSKVALIIGNAAYESSPLKNPVNDATDMADRLQSLGFKVISGTNLTLRQMMELLDRFDQTIKAGDVGLFFYSGHGVQSQERNYLIPIKSNINEEKDFQFEALDAGRVISSMDAKHLKASIIILDACRDNPFKSTTRSLSRGLTVVTAGSGSIVVFSTAPGEVAFDGEGRNGLFTGVLLDNLKRNVEINAMLTDARKEVALRSNYKQISYVSSSLLDPIYLGEKQANLPRVGVSFSNDSEIPNEKIAVLKDFYNARLALTDRFDIVSLKDNNKVSADQMQYLVNISIKQPGDGQLHFVAEVLDNEKSYHMEPVKTTAANIEDIFSATTELARLTANRILGIDNFSFIPVTNGVSLDFAVEAGVVPLNGALYPSYGLSVGGFSQYGSFSTGFHLTMLITGLSTDTIYGFSMTSIGALPILILPSAFFDLLFGDKTDGLAFQIGIGGFYDFAFGAVVSASLGLFYKNVFVRYEPMCDIKIGIPVSPLFIHNITIGYSVFLGQKAAKVNAIK